MRYLKRLILAVLIYMAVYLPFVVIMQSRSDGGDYTAAYTVGGVFGAVELALGSIIKINEERETAKIEKASEKDAESEQNNE